MQPRNKPARAPVLPTAILKERSHRRRRGAASSQEDRRSGAVFMSPAHAGSKLPSARHIQNYALKLIAAAAKFGGLCRARAAVAHGGHERHHLHLELLDGISRFPFAHTELYMILAAAEGRLGEPNLEVPGLRTEGSRILESRGCSARGKRKEKSKRAPDEASRACRHRGQEAKPSPVGGRCGTLSQARLSQNLRDSHPIAACSRSSARHPAEDPLHQDEAIFGTQRIAVLRRHRAVAELVADLRPPAHDVLKGIEGPGALRIQGVVTRRAGFVEDRLHVGVARRRVGTLSRGRDAAALLPAHAIPRGLS